jgi:hypothetical protein
MSTTGPIRALLAGLLALLVSATSAATQPAGRAGPGEANTVEAQHQILANVVADGHAPAAAPAPENSGCAVLPATEADPGPPPSASPHTPPNPDFCPRVARAFPPARGPPAAET